MKYLRIVASIIILLIIFILFGCNKNLASISTDSTHDKTKTESSELKKVTLSSHVLNKDMNLNIYLPKGYNSKTKFPVLYLIHGLDQNEDAWMQGLKIDKKADKLIDSNKIMPLIIVAPQMDNSWGINSNRGRYEDYLIDELIPYIDSNYRTPANRENRFIGGLSMGGFISLHIAFNHPDIFSKVGGHSPAISTGNATANDSFLYPNLAIKKIRDPIYIAQDKDLSALKVYLDCGDKDKYKFFEGCEQLYEILQSKGVRSEYHLNAGTHDDTYWEANLENYLLFYAGK